MGKCDFHLVLDKTVRNAAICHITAIKIILLFKRCAKQIYYDEFLV